MSGETGGEASKTSLVFKVLGWLLGSLSLLNLIKDLTTVELYGAIRDWTAAYGLFVSSVGSFLFGWIHFGWIQIDHMEHHVVVLSALVSGAAARAAYATEIRRGKTNPVDLALGTLIVFLGLVLLVVIVIPSPYSLWLALIGFVVLNISLLSKIDNQESEIDLNHFKRELTIVAAIFMLIILINYLVLKP